MINTFVTAHHEFVVLSLVFIILFFIGNYIKAYIVKKVSDPRIGTKEGCSTCAAMQGYTEKLPEIAARQEECYKTALPEIAKNIAVLQTDIESMDARISKLFNLIEQSWLAQINRLESALHRSMCLPLPQELPPYLAKSPEGGEATSVKGTKRTSRKSVKVVSESKPKRKKGGDKSDS